MARPRSKLTEQQSQYVDGVMEGKSKNAAAKSAGYPSAQCPEKSVTVKEEIAKAREQISDLTTLKRLDVIEGIMESISCARMMSDPAGIRQGWVEIGKILGVYAPEVKQVNLTVGQERLLHKFQALSTEDLLAIATGKVIDGEATQVQSH
jgi:hypothetical protein